ncbi:MAG: hypothetical protein E6Q67_11285, partial [Roseateles sp.]
MQLALVAPARAHQCIEHPPAPLVLDQRRIGHRQATKQRRLTLPVVQAGVGGAVQSDLAGLVALRHHPGLTAVLEHLRVGQMEGPVQHRAAATPGQRVARELVPLDDRALDAVVEGLDEHMQRLAPHQAEGIGLVRGQTLHVFVEAFDYRVKR